MGNNAVDVAALLPLILKAIEIGLPYVNKAVQDFKDASNHEPTVEELDAFLADLQPPTDYGTE